MTDAVVLETMRRLVEEMFVPKIYNAYGRAGTAALLEVTAFLPQMYVHVEPPAGAGTVYVVRRLEGASPVELEAALNGTFRIEKRVDRLPPSVAGVLVVELLGGGAMRVAEDATVDEVALSRVAVVYRYRGEQEHFVVLGEQQVVPNPAPGHASVFARPTFSSLKEALADYRDQLVRTSTCFILSTAWDDHNRLFLKAKPEYLMRRSLSQHLVRLRDAEVRPEQNVDESHPVDIKVTWTFTTRLALIEIKWLGKSRYEGEVTATYNDARALEGAKQLANYLDANRTFAPKRDTRGYLVIIDARRYGLNAASNTVSRENGMYYENAEITYDPPYHTSRDDFDPPVRMFVEPVCQDAS